MVAAPSHPVSGVGKLARRQIPSHPVEELINNKCNQTIILLVEKLRNWPKVIFLPIVTGPIVICVFIFYLRVVSVADVILMAQDLPPVLPLFDTLL